MSPSAQSAGRAPGKRRTGALVVPEEPRWRQRLAAGMTFALLRGVNGTLRWHWHDRSGFFDRPAGPVIYCIWHNRLPLCMRVYYHYVRPRNPTAGMAALVSASRDGGFLTSVLRCFKVQPVRGSSSRRGPQALLELTTWAERGYDLALTPDGPRGPCYVVQEGVISLAQVTCLPIIPASAHLTRKIRLHSWDRFQIPLPFARCDFFLEKPLRVPRDASAAEREALRQDLEQVLRRITQD